MTSKNLQNYQNPSKQQKKTWKNFQIWYDLNDFAAGLLFLVGSILFFWKSTHEAGIWCFVIGSALFTVRPGINTLRDVLMNKQKQD